MPAKAGIQLNQVFFNRLLRVLFVEDREANHEFCLEILPRIAHLTSEWGLYREGLPLRVEIPGSVQAKDPSPLRPAPTEKVT